jgi:single-strand DNA-binding protein
MAVSLNKVMLIGTVGKDPECKAAGGFNIVNLSIATQNVEKDKQTGAYVKTSEWHKIVLFGKAADYAMSYVKKGSLVYVEGKMKTSKYTGKDNIERYVTSVTASSITSLERKPNHQNNNQSQEGNYGNYKPSHHDKKPNYQEPLEDDFGDELPF